jgi:acyl-CoA synthetase (AMP-forming)/AMP-acid ligase II
VSAAGGLETLYQEYLAQGGMVMTAIIETADYTAPALEDLQEWADTYGMTFPVLADPDSTVMYTYATSGSIGLPFSVVYNNGVLVEVTQAGESDFTALFSEGDTD